MTQKIKRLKLILKEENGKETNGTRIRKEEVEDQLHHKNMRRKRIFHISSASSSIHMAMMPKTALKEKRKGQQQASMVDV